VSWFSLQFVSETFVFLRRIQRDTIKNVYWYSCNAPVVIVLEEPEFCGQIFDKTQIKFHENPSNWSLVVPCWRTDRHDEANSRFSQFCERPYKYVRRFLDCYRVDIMVLMGAFVQLYITNTPKVMSGFILLKIFKVRAFYVIDHTVYLHTILRVIVCLHLMLFRRRMLEIHMVMWRDSTIVFIWTLHC
jgi:hypothetical protein